MSLKIDGQTYYRTSEVYRMVGITRNTLFRWLKNGIPIEFERRDRRGWRLFTIDEIESLRTEANKVTIERLLR